MIILLKAFLRELARGCWFRHSDRVHGRNADGKLVFTCERCGDVQTPDLSQDRYRGSAHVPAEILGKPIYSVRRQSEKTRLFGKRRA